MEPEQNPPQGEEAYGAEELAHIHRLVREGSGVNWMGTRARLHDLEDKMQRLHNQWFCWHCERWNLRPAVCPQCGRSVNSHLEA